MITRFHLLCLLKHPAFSEEREWRMIANFERCGKIRHFMKLRPSRNMLIPYLDIPLPVGHDAQDPERPNMKQYYRWKIKEVVVSPHPHKELAIAALKLVVPEYIGNYVGVDGRYNDDAITASAIPYVNW